MSKSLRLSETWFRRGLWLVALIFAGFLSGLGGALVSDLPKVEQTRTLDDFIDRPRADALRAEIKKTTQQLADISDALQQAHLQSQRARADTQSAREAFNNWLATRHATGQSAHDAELQARTEALDTLKAADRSAQSRVETAEQGQLDLRQQSARQNKELLELEQAAHTAWRIEARAQELRVFLYRLALTLPLLVLAGWLFVKKRKGTYWPFVWGFILFALLTFFVELVPYLPSYGGYVRYAVGIVLTVLVGRYVILALNRYLERQKQTEQQPDIERRQALGYDVALTRLGKNVCPGCERAVDLKNEHIDYCPHCGICLFDRCTACQTRKSSFSHFCHACGSPAQTTGPDAA